MRALVAYWNRFRAWLAKDYINSQRERAHMAEAASYGHYQDKLDAERKLEAFEMYQYIFAMASQNFGEMRSELIDSMRRQPWGQEQGVYEQERLASAILHKMFSDIFEGKEVKFTRYEDITGEKRGRMDISIVGGWAVEFEKPDYAPPHSGASYFEQRNAKGKVIKLY